MSSIRRGLLAWVLGALSVGACVIALATYLVSLEEMNEVLDAQLQQVALSVLVHYQQSARTLEPLPTSVPARPSAPRARADEEDLEGLDLATQVWTLEGERVFASRPDLQLPFSRTEGFATVQTPHGPWRVYTDRSAHYLTQAAQAADVRARLAAAVALKSLVPGLAAVPPLALLIAYALGRGLRPLLRTTRDVRQRSPALLTPIATSTLPLEIRPLIASINALMARLDEALGVQRRFTADAAHELRTPLTALRLQLQSLADERDEAARADALADMRRGLERASRLVGQLLELSRLEPEATEVMRRDRVDLAELARTVVADFAARAEAQAIDLGVVVDGAARTLVVTGDAEQLRVLLNNLLDNALRHTPAGGKVDVRVEPGEHPGEARLEVLDSGVGVPEAERERIFRRFYRLDGNASEAGEGGGSAGLGLAIVEAVARRHAADIRLGAGLAQGDREGLSVRVTFRVEGHRG